MSAVRGRDIPKGQREPGIEPDRVADDFGREAVALKRYRFHPMMLIGDEPQRYRSYRDIAESEQGISLTEQRIARSLAGKKGWSRLAARGAADAIYRHRCRDR